MKVYSIGRDAACNIVIDDNTDVISRRHAILNVAPSGKMTIVDQSHNGTYVNGIRISSNVPVPVTRKDNISFAHVARLDWNQIPNTSASIIRWGIIGVIALALVGGGVWGYLAWSGQAAPEESNEGIATVDSTEIKAEQEKKAEMEKQKEDSIKKQVQDSIDKVRKSTVVKPAIKKKDAEPKKEDVKKPEEPKKEEPKTNRQRG
jgi:pSer/pThr/pTyr-binding forkhead associated (FHA) protein